MQPLTDSPDTTRELNIVYLVAFFDNLSFMIIHPTLPFLAQGLGATPVTVGMLLGIYGVCQLFSGLVIGPYSDRIGRRPLLIAALSSMILSFVFLALARSVAQLYIARVWSGLSAVVGILSSAYVADLVKAEKRSTAFSRIAVTWGLAMLVGPAVAGALSRFGNGVPVLAAAGLSSVSCLACIFGLPPRSEVRRAAARPGSILGYAKLFRVPDLRGLWVATIVYFFGFHTYFSSFPLFAQRAFTVDGRPFGTREVGFFLSYLGTFGILVQLFIYPMLNRRVGERGLIIAGASSCTLGYLALAGLVHSPWIWLPFIGLFFAFGNYVNRPSLVGLISTRTDTGDQGLALGLTGAINASCQLAASVVATFVIQRGLLSAWACSPAALNALLVLTMLMATTRPVSARG